jgi:fumarate hydratase class II
MPFTPRLLQEGLKAVGTGVNAHPQFAVRAIARLAARTGLALTPAPDRFASLAAQTPPSSWAAARRRSRAAQDLERPALDELGSAASAIRRRRCSPAPSRRGGNPVIPRRPRWPGTHAATRRCRYGGRPHLLNVMLLLIAHALLQSIEPPDWPGARQLSGLVVHSRGFRDPFAQSDAVDGTAPGSIRPRHGPLPGGRRSRRPILDVAIEEIGTPREELARR